MTLREEFQTRNFSIYGQWFGILSMILCFATGLANIFTLFSKHALLIIFCALALASSLIILFIEVPLLLRICPTSPKFDELIRKVNSNYIRAGTYCVMAIVQFLSTIIVNSSLIAAAVFLLIAAICYGLAALKGQAFIGSKTLGGAGIAQMIV